MAQGKFATSVACMDGRIQAPLMAWIKENFPVDFVDVITEPGIDRIISENQDLDPIKKKIDISINAHKSELVIVSGHFDCAGNPVSDAEHIAQIKDGVDVISAWNPNLKVIGVWVDDSWIVNLL